MSTLRIPTAQVFRLLLEPTRYKDAFGGRGSGKSHFFGGLVVEECLPQPGTLDVRAQAITPLLQLIFQPPDILSLPECH